MSVTEQLNQIRSTLPSGITLVAVSKFHPVEMLSEAYAAGQRIFGESREQELKVKHEALPKDIEWHFIGHLQSNKVRAIVPYVHCIQSVDSVHLLEEIERQAARCDRHIDLLLEVHVAQEESKSGFTPAELLALLSEQRPDERWTHCHFRGLMGMATNTDDEAQVRREFRSLRTLFDQARPLCPTFDTLSMGMSDDYPIAIEEGCTMVRVGSSIFGPRQY
jgi:hypothetical protein